MNNLPPRVRTKDLKVNTNDSNGNPVVSPVSGSPMQRIKDEAPRKSQSLPRVPPQEVRDAKQRHSSSGPEKDLNIVVLGCKGVGKTALIVRFLTRRFIGDYANEESLCSCTSYLDGKPLNLSIQDTKQTSSEWVNSEYISWGDAFVIVFSLTSMHSFNLVEPLFTRLVREKRSNKDRPPIVIAANKSDLCHQRAVSEPELGALVRRLQCPVVRTSASEDYPSVLEVFTCLFQQALRSKKNGGKKNGASKIAQIRETLRSLADFRNRTNTF